MARGKNSVVIPKTIPCNRDGKNDAVKYIAEFDRLNGLKSVNYTFKGN